MTDELRSTPPLGSEMHPLTAEDLPFTVPETGRYWLIYGGHLTRLPESPKGSVLALEPIGEPTGEWSGMAFHDE